MSDIHPELNLILQGANILTLMKNNHRYGMTFAWGMAADYDRLLIVIGGQSSTGRNLEIGDLVGVSCLNPKQKDIALRFGDGHSDEIDKFVDSEIEIKKDVILIKDASRQLVCKVIDKFFLKDNNEDPLFLLQVLDFSCLHQRFLNYIDLK